MSDIKMTVSGDILIFEIHETKPYTFPDEYRTEKLPIGQIDRLMVGAAKENLSEDFQRIDYFWVPQVRRWIGFVLTAFRERVTGPWDESYSGPYLFPDRTPPDSADPA